MTDAQTVYVDDSGTDGKSKIAAAAFCVSTVDRWQELLDKWNKIAEHAGFELKIFTQPSLQLAGAVICMGSANPGILPRKIIRGRGGLTISARTCLVAWQKHW